MIEVNREAIIEVGQDPPGRNDALFGAPSPAGLHRVIMLRCTKRHHPAHPVDGKRVSTLADTLAVA